MKKLTYVALFDVSTLDRVDAESVESLVVNTSFASGCECHGVKEELLRELELPKDSNVLVLLLSDFMDGINDQEIDMGQYWFSYVNVTLKTQNE